MQQEITFATKVQIKEKEKKRTCIHTKICIYVYIMNIHFSFQKKVLV